MTKTVSRPVEYAASVLPGLEEIAGEEVRARFQGAQVVDVQRGWIVFRAPNSIADLRKLCTTEDVFAVLFRTSRLPPYRKGALSLLNRMARSSHHWDQALKSFQQTRRRSVRRVTFRVVAQMTGKHSFRRKEVQDAILNGVQARWTGWKPVADDAHLEVWAPIVGDWATIAVRLSDHKMRHRTYKVEHRPASLRPTLAAAMIYLSNPQPNDRFCDPMCGTGTILAERALSGRSQRLLGGDINPDALRAAQANLSGVRNLGAPCVLQLWDAKWLPIRSGSLDAIVCNLPFGKKVGSHADNPDLYSLFFQQLGRVLCSSGRAVLLTSEKELMRQLLHTHTQLHLEQQVLVGVLGQAARIYVLRKK